MEMIQKSNSHQELVDELTRLNEALKLQLDQCHKYIERLELELKQAEAESPIESNQNLSQALQREVIELRQQVDRLNNKVRDKREQVKKSERAILNLEGALEGVIRQKQQLQHILQRVEGSKEKLEQTNRHLNAQIQQLLTQNQQASSQIRQLENKHLQAVNELSRMGEELQVFRRAKIDLDATLCSRVSVLSSSPRGDPLFNPVTKRITIDERALRQREQNQKQHLLQSVNNLQEELNVLREQRSRDSSQISKLKSDLVNLKIEHSSLLSKNNQLIETNVRLERQKNEMFVKLEGYNSGKVMIITNDKSAEGQPDKSLGKSYESANRTSATVGSLHINRVVPNDGQVPVRDRSSIRVSHVSLPQAQGNHPVRPPSIIPRKSNVMMRQNAIAFSSFK